MLTTWCSTPMKPPAGPCWPQGPQTETRSKASTAAQCLISSPMRGFRQPEMTAVENIGDVALQFIATYQDLWYGFIVIYTYLYYRKIDGKFWQLAMLNFWGTQCFTQTHKLHQNQVWMLLGSFLWTLLLYSLELEGKHGNTEYTQKSHTQNRKFWKVQMLLAVLLQLSGISKRL